MRRIPLILLGIFLVLLSWHQVMGARAGLRVQTLQRDGVPLLYVAPDDEELRPGIVIAHGFAASKQIMLGYAHVLAHAGYRVMLLDFHGHAANPQSLSSRHSGNVPLGSDLDVATEALLAQPGVDATRLGVLGHSMGSGVVMTAAINDPDRYAATVAVSPTSAGVTPELPRALMLQAGSIEQPFVANARRLLQAAGGEGATRRFVWIPNAEHISILFRDESHRAALEWFNGALGYDGVTSYRDRRIVWYGVQLLGWMLAWVGVAVWLKEGDAERLPVQRQLTAMAVAPMAAIIGVGAISLVVPQIDHLGGLAVGAGLALWLACAGCVRLVVQQGVPRPTLGGVGRGLLLGGVLWASFGLLAHQTWMNWTLVAPRLHLWPLLVVGCVPWFLASGIVQANSTTYGRLGWWIAESIVLVVGPLGMLYLVPSLGFLILVLPTWPLIAGLIALAGAPLRSPWGYAIGGSLFMGWLLATVFPLVGG